MRVSNDFFFFFKYDFVREGMTKVLTLQTAVILELLLESKELPVGYWFERDSFTMVKTSVRAFALRSVFNGVFTQHQFTRPHNSLFL